MAASARVRQILSEVRDLNDDEKAELEAELFAEDAATGRAWGEEVDRRAARVLAGEVSGIARDELRSLFAMPPAEARTRLAALLDARDYYEHARPGLGAIFEFVAQRTLDAIESAPERFPSHPFATTPGVRRALFPRPPRFPYALSYLVRADRGPYVLAAEHLRRAPMYWSARLRAFGLP